LCTQSATLVLLLALRLARLSRSLCAYCLSLRNPGPLIRWTSGTVEFGGIELCAPSLRPWPLIRWTSGTVEFGWIELCAPSLRPWYCFLLCTWLDFRGACVHTACFRVTRGLSSVGRVEPLSLAGLSFVRPVCDLGLSSVGRVEPLSLEGLSFVCPVCDLGTAPCSAPGPTFEEFECILPVSA
jgi:hypothetical protein